MSRDRDHILEQALKHELRAAGTPPAGACLDAETLGAWTDGGLEPSAMTVVEAHVSTCARCQALVSTLIKSAPGTVGTRTPGILGTPGTLSLWRWWLAPIAAGVTAVTLWMVVPEQQKLATAPPQPEIASPAQAPAAMNAPVAAPTLPPAAPEKDAAVAQSIDKLARRDNEVAAAAREDRQQEKQVGERKEEAPALQERARLADAAAPAAATAAAPPPPPMPAAPRAPAEFGALEKSARAVAVIEIATLDPSLGWRIVGDRIERSGDGGKTWRVTRQNSSDGLTAGSAPSNEVCWFVGRAGRVLLTNDSGATFRDVSLVEPLDLASIAAIDARNASVYSVVGRRFRTDDGGRTWRPF